MKKSTRILSLLMAFAMLIGTFSVMGSAYSAYKGNDIKFDNLDAATFTTEQYASMGLDEVDRMLAEEQLSVNVYIGTLDVTSIDNALASVEELLESVSSLLGMLGNAKDLSIKPLEGKRRSAGTINGIEADLAIVYAVFDFLSANAGLLENYANGTFGLGILNSFVADYVFDVRELLIGLLYGACDAGKAIDYDYFDARDAGVANAGLPAKYLDKTNGMLVLLQDLLNDVVLGTWQKLDDYFDNPYDDHEEVQPGFYAFKNGSAAGADVSDEEIDTGAYDYYGWVHPDNWVTVGLGEAVRVSDGAAAPAASYVSMDITGNVKGYDFIENLLQRAYNYVLVPVLNRDTVRWLKEEIGFTFPEQYCKAQLYNESTKEWYNNPNYDPDYPGDEPANIENNALYKLFETENLHIDKVEFAAGETLVGKLNNILGDFVNTILKTKSGKTSASGYSWTWTYGDNSKLFQNICEVARFVLAETGDEFFGSHVSIKSAAEVIDMNDQQVVAYVLRNIINSSIDEMYIDDSQQTVADVGYAIVEQLLWQDIPQITYTKPVKGAMTDEQYYNALLDKALTMLMDEAAYKLNQEMDVNLDNPTNRDPLNGAGLLPYQGDEGSYENNLVILGEWAIKTYGRLLALTFNLADSKTHTINDFWLDLDTIFNALLPLKSADGNGTILPADVSSSNHVLETILIDSIVKPLLNLNATNFVHLFDKNANGIFAQNNGVEIIMVILENVFDLLFPNVFKEGVKTVDALMDNKVLSAMVFDLIKTLGYTPYTEDGKSNNVKLSARAADIVYVALPIVCMILGLSDDQEFGELENYMPKAFATTQLDKDGKLVDKTSETFSIYNGTSGVNTGYTDKDGNLTVDQSYTYNIKSVFANGYRANGTSKELSPSRSTNTIPGGSSATVTVSGYEAGMTIVVDIVYEVTDESGDVMATLTNTSYAYAAAVSADDDSIERSKDAGNGRTLKYESDVYIDTNDSLSKLAKVNFRIVDSKENKDVENPASTGTVTVSGVTGASWATKNTNAATNQAALFGQGGTYFIAPFEIVDGCQRFAKIYDKDGNEIGDNGGIPAGEYSVTAAVNVAGTTVNVPIRIHIYDSFGLESAFDKAVAANRQITGYDETKAIVGTLFENYTTALKNAASIAIKPKDGSTFANDIKCTSGEATNLYELYANELADSIEALSQPEYELSSGVSGIEGALKKYSGINYKVEKDGKYSYKVSYEFDDPNCVYFSYRDYVPQTYKRYRTAKNNAEDLIASQTYYISGPLAENATSEQKAKYDAQCAAADAYEAPVISALSSTYAIHMVELTGKRLIPLKGDKSKLEKVMNEICVLKDKVTYTNETKAVYDRALAFAQTVDGNKSAKPSMINTAMNELMYAWKMLDEAADYSTLQDNIALVKEEAIDKVENEGFDINAVDEQTVYTAATYGKLLEAYNAALDLIEQALPKNSDNDKKIADAAAALLAAYNNLAEYVEGGDTEEAEFEINTEWSYTTDYGNTLILFDMTTEYLEEVIFEDDTSLAGYDGFILGVPAYEDFYADDGAFKCEGCTVELETNDIDCIGTGAFAVFYNEGGEEVGRYCLVVTGDVDGTGIPDVDDASMIAKQATQAYMWDYEPENWAKYVAGDTDNDFAITVDEAVLVAKVGGMAGEFAYDEAAGHMAYFE